MHGTSYNLKHLFWTELYQTVLQEIQYYYREASTPLIQHVCVILAFELATQTHHEFKLEYSLSANPGQSFDS